MTPRQSPRPTAEGSGNVLTLILATVSALILFIIAPPIQPILRFLIGCALVGSALWAAVAARWPDRWWARLGAVASVSLLVLMMAVLPIVIDIVSRQQGGPVSLNDNPLQMEAATDFLRAGKNPYRENFRGTVVEQWNSQNPADPANPVLDHLVMPPGHLLASTLTSAVARPLIGWYDERMLNLLVYAVFLILVTRLGRTLEQRLRNVVLLGLNPLALPFLLAGTSDLLVITALFAVGLALRARRWTWAVAFLGLATSLKLFALPFWPAVLVLPFAKTPAPWANRLRHTVRPLLAGIGVLALFFLPFLVWDAPALIDDLIRYSTGTSPTSYHIMGLGLGGQLLRLGIVAEDSIFPFWIFQLLTVGILLTLTLPLLARRPSASSALLVGAATLFFSLYFGRFFHTSYVAHLFVLATVVFAFWQDERANAHGISAGSG